MYVKRLETKNKRVIKGEFAVCVAVELLSLLLVSVLWGCTNPFLKRGTAGIENVTKTSRVSQLLAEVKFLLLNLKVNPEISFCLPLCKFEMIINWFNRTFPLILLHSISSHFC